MATCRRPCVRRAGEQRAGRRAAGVHVGIRDTAPRRHMWHAAAAPVGGPTSHARPWRDRRADRRHQVWRGDVRTQCAAGGASADVVVIGAGVAGLTCARTLRRRGCDVLVVDAGDEVGGRVRTDVHPDGFLLDRGFHIYLTSYPEAMQQLDGRALELQPFYAGAQVRVEGAWHRVADPVKHPVDALQSLLPDNAVGDVLDKLRVGLLRVASLLTQPYDFLTAPETTTLARLQQLGFSEAMVQRFWRPFLGGIFFDNELQVTDRLLTFVMRSLATGQNCLPSAGIGAVAKQLAAGVEAERIVLNTRVISLGACTANPQWTILSLDGSSQGTITAKRAVVLAVEGPEAARLTGLSGAGDAKRMEGVGTVCLYFAAPSAPCNNEPVLYLNGDGPGRLVNNACVPSAVAPSYAPPGQALISASVVGVPRPGSSLDPRSPAGDKALAAAVSEELGQWFGPAEVATWRHLRTYVVPFAQPGQSPPTRLERPVRVDGHSSGASSATRLYVCGDHVEAATLDGALRSGRRAAEAVLEDLSVA